MIRDVLIGWCTIHALIWFSLAVLAFWIVYAVVMGRAVRKPLPPVAQAVKPPTPSWARARRTPARHARRGANR